MIQKLYKKLKELEELETIANFAEAAYEKNPENKKIETEFDVAYQNQFNAFLELSEMLAKYIGCDIKVARKMISGKRTQLWDIIKKGSN